MKKSLASIFFEILDPAGSEIYLKPASHYFELDKPVDMYTLTHLASMRKEVFLGYKKTTQTFEKPVEIKLNPDKETTIAFSEKDWLIVLAQD